jgi:hypothetical protein
MKRLFIFLSVLLLAACAGKTVKKEELAKVRKAAIIGLEVQQQKSVSAGDLLGAALKTNKNGASPHIRTESSHIDPIYQDAATKLAQQTGWKVLTLEQVRGNAAYKKFFADKTGGMHSAPILNDRFDLYAPTGILDSWAIMTTKAEKLEELAKAMGVDAVVYASSVVNLNNDSMLASMVGKGEFHPSSNLNFFVLDSRTGEKIFVDSANGPKVEEGARNAVGVADVDKLNDLARTATALSLDMVMKDLNTKE